VLSQLLLLKLLNPKPKKLVVPARSLTDLL